MLFLLVKKTGLLYLTYDNKHVGHFANDSVISQHPVLYAKPIKKALRFLEGLLSLLVCVKRTSEACVVIAHIRTQETTFIRKQVR